MRNEKARRNLEIADSRLAAAQCGYPSKYWLKGIGWPKRQKSKALEDYWYRPIENRVAEGMRRLSSPRRPGKATILKELASAAGLPLRVITGEPSPSWHSRAKLPNISPWASFDVADECAYDPASEKLNRHIGHALQKGRLTVDELKGFKEFWSDPAPKLPLPITHPDADFLKLINATTAVRQQGFNLETATEEEIRRFFFGAQEKLHSVDVTTDTDNLKRFIPKWDF